MNVRPAHVSDVPAMCELINSYAERGVMLHRSMESLYDALREFHVAEDDGWIVGTVAVDIFWADLAEVKSLAVAGEYRGRGVGALLMDAAVQDARRMGVRRLFALTYQQNFFLRHGFEVMDRAQLPEKVWRECLHCPKADACDEIAMIRMLQSAQPAGAEARQGQEAGR
ncbi:MAG: N-acetyltransferase [Phycisphaerae bacterium]